MHWKNWRIVLICVWIWVFPKMVVPPKSSILLGFSMIFTIHFGGWNSPFFGNIHLMIWYSWKLPLSTSRTEPQGSSRCCRWWPSHWPSNGGELRESQGPTHVATCRPGKLRCPPKKGTYSKHEISSSNPWLSGHMLVFVGIRINVFLKWKWQASKQHTFQRFNAQWQHMWPGKQRPPGLSAC